MKACPPRCPVALARARRRFERWRQSSRRGARLPAQLWSLAVELAREHGVSKTAATLRLEYYALKKRMQAEAADGASVEPRHPTFVELALGSAAGSTLESAPARGCVLELADGRGLKLRVELAAQSVAQLSGVVRALWEAAR